MIMRGALCGMVLVALLSGCTSGSGGDAKPEPTKAVATINPSKTVATINPSKTVATIDPSKATALKLGVDLKIVAKLPRNIGKQYVYFNSFTEDGQVIGSANLPETNEDGNMGTVGSQYYPVMYDLDTKHLTVISHDVRAEKTSIGLTMAGTKDTVLWWETPSTQEAADVKIYAYDRHSKKVTRLSDTLALFGGDLVASGNTAYFSEPGKNPGVYSVPVDGSTPPKLLVPDAHYTRLAGDTLTYWLKDSQFNRDIKTGKTTPVPVSPYAKHAGFCGAEFTETFESWCVGREVVHEEPKVISDAVLTIKESSGRTTVFKPFPTDSDNAVPYDPVTLGKWTGITMRYEDAGDTNREFLVNLATGVIKVFPKYSSLTDLSQDGKQALVDDRANKHHVQYVVQIPTT